MNRSMKRHWTFFLLALPLVAASCSDSGTEVERERSAPEAWHGAFSEHPTLRELARYRWGDVPRGAEVAWERIGPEGGRVELHGFEIVVPAGAVDRPQRFSIRVPPRNSVSSFFVHAEFEPHNVRFNVPVTLRTPLEGTTSEGSDANIVWWNERRDHWVDLPTVRTQDGRLETETLHFSIYGTKRTARGVTVAGG